MTREPFLLLDSHVAVGHVILHPNGERATYENNSYDSALKINIGLTRNIGISLCLCSRAGKIHDGFNSGSPV